MLNSASREGHTLFRAKPIAAHFIDMAAYELASLASHSTHSHCYEFRSEAARSKLICTQHPRSPWELRASHGRRRSCGRAVPIVGDRTSKTRTLRIPS